MVSRSDELGVSVSKSVWLLLLALAVIVIVALWKQTPTNSKTIIPQATVSNSVVEKPNKNSDKKNNVKQQSSSKRNDGNDENSTYDPYQSEVLKAQFLQIGDAYADSIQYPISSQPIKNAEDVREYEPFEQSEVDLPFPEDNGDESPIRIVAATDQFQYFKGDVVGIRVQIQNAPEQKFTQVKGIISGAKGELPSQIDFRPNDQSMLEYRAVFDTKVAPTHLLTNEMLVTLHVIVGERSLTTTVAFKVATASAQITGTQAVQPQGANLVIPVQVNVFQDGYYFLTAILQDSLSGKPLIQLQAEQRLSQGNGVIQLKAHISALKQQGSEGPYVLRSMTLNRGAEENESFDVPGSTTHPQFSIKGFPFSSYQNEAHTDELEQERLEFLRNAGAIDENEENAE